MTTQPYWPPDYVDPMPDYPADDAALEAVVHHAHRLEVENIWLKVWSTGLATLLVLALLDIAHLRGWIEWPL